MFEVVVRCTLFLVCCMLIVVGVSMVRCFLLDGCCCLLLFVVVCCSLLSVVCHALSLVCVRY